MSARIKFEYEVTEVFSVNSMHSNSSCMYNTVVSRRREIRNLLLNNLRLVVDQLVKRGTVPCLEIFNSPV